MFSRSSFFFCQLGCLSFDLQLFITHLVPSNFSWHLRNIFKWQWIFSHIRQDYYRTIWVLRWVSYKNRNCLTFASTWVNPGVRFCSCFFFVLCFVPNVAYASGLSTIYCLLNSGDQLFHQYQQHEHSSLSSANWTYKRPRYTGADPGFQVRGAHLKKLRRAEGGAKMFWVFRVKNHDFTPNIFFFLQF